MRQVVVKVEVERCCRGVRWKEVRDGSRKVNDHFLFKRVKSWVWLGLGKGLGPSLLFWILRIWIKRCKWIRFVFLAQGPML